MRVCPEEVIFRRVVARQKQDRAWQWWLVERSKGVLANLNDTAKRYSQMINILSM
jgi:hypothetical protein